MMSILSRTILFNAKWCRMARAGTTRRHAAIGNPERTFGKVLRRIRQKQGMSQEKLAAEAGYHRTYIGLLERAKFSPSLRTIFNLAAVLRIPPSKLVREVETLMRKRHPEL